jgi:tetratricopeptide (TPR) repeat protein
MGLDEPLGAVVRDQWDRDAFKRKWEEQQEVERKEVLRQRAKMEAVEKRDWDTVMKLLDEDIESSGGAPRAKFQKFVIMAKEVGDYPRAYQYASELVEGAWDDAQLLNTVAWFIVDEPLEKRDFDLAMKAANRANELTDGDDAAILDTVARVYYERGDLRTAVEYQRKANDRAKGSGFEEEIAQRLKEYEEKLGKGR